MFLSDSEAWLKKRLESDRHNEFLLLQLGDVYRKQGEHNKAITCYQQIIESDPNHKVARYLRSLSPQHYPSQKDVVIDNYPVPRFQLSNFLDHKELRALWGFIEKNIHLFSPTNTNRYAHQHNESPEKHHRKSRVLYKNQLGELNDIFTARLMEEISKVTSLLLMNEFDIDTLELQLTTHQDGDFYTIHKDRSNQKKSKYKRDSSTRRITYVYYFYKPPKKFSGGDLLLFDTNFKDDTYSTNYCRIHPEHNSMIFFPSAAYHQVTKVSMNSDNFYHGRFTLNGWAHQSIE